MHVCICACTVQQTETKRNREREKNTETEGQPFLLLFTVTGFVVGCQASIFETAAHKSMGSVVAPVTAVIVQTRVIG